MQTASIFYLVVNIKGKIAFHTANIPTPIIYWDHAVFHDREEGTVLSKNRCQQALLSGCRTLVPSLGQCLIRLAHNGPRNGKILGIIACCASQFLVLGLLVYFCCCCCWWFVVICKTNKNIHKRNRFHQMKIFFAISLCWNVTSFVQLWKYIVTILIYHLCMHTHEHKCSCLISQTPTRR